jgi:crotonobetaine/carnitine-CoA ligase
VGEDLCVIGELLELRAAERPDQTAIIFPEGPQWSYAELRARVRDRAAGLKALGVRQDEFVLSWQPNGPQAVLTFLALNQLGAVYVPINIAYRGGVLEHVIRNAGARLMVAHGALVDRLAEIDRAQLGSVVVIGPERPHIQGLELVDQGALDADGATLASPPRPLEPWDTHMVIYTSGTTGPSKGVLSSYRHTATSAWEFRNVGPGDRNFTALPMHHVGGPYAILWALLHGGSCVMAEAFRTQDFWDIVRRYGVTTTGLLGAMVRFLLAQPPSPSDRDHGLRSVIIAPFDEAAPAFAERFGVDVYTEFNMSELSVPMFAGPNPTAPGTCGKVRAGIEARLVDEHDIEVPDGRPGELILRADQPWTLSHGYLNDPQATARAWRNGWFHTGDLFRRDAEGHYFFLDRAKDALRRRGENISSFEVESAVMLHPAVREAAVIAAPGDGGEDEVMAAVALRPGAAFDPAELLRFLQPRLAHFMLPRYVRVMDELPRTATQKVEKHRLRAEGVTPGTWDRDAAGVVVRRERLERRG